MSVKVLLRIVNTNIYRDIRWSLSEFCHRVKEIFIPESLHSLFGF